MDSTIIGFRRSDLFGYSNYFNGFACRHLFSIQDVKSRYILDNMLYLRDKAETNVSVKQLIPYVAVQNAQSAALMMYTRTKKGAEQRLHRKCSIGIGGHMHPVDVVESLHESIIVAAMREISEEIDIPDSPSNIRSCLYHIGYINDDSNEVGKVHFGVAFALSLPDKVFTATKKREEIGELSFNDPDEIQKMIEAGVEFENWSKAYSQYFSSIRNIS